MKRVIMGFMIVMLMGVFSFSAMAKGETATAKRHSFGHRVLTYIPNRIFDVLDIFRARIRLGPGVSVSARVTEVVDVGLGAHVTVFAGLPGPRRARKVPLPVGAEMYAGIELSLAEAGGDDKVGGPKYSNTEAGAGVHAGMVGIDVGIDPLEIIDLVAGIFFLDMLRDDI